MAYRLRCGSSNVIRRSSILFGDLIGIHRGSVGRHNLQHISCVHAPRSTVNNKLCSSYFSSQCAILDDQQYTEDDNSSRNNEEGIRIARINSNGAHITIQFSTRSCNENTSTLYQPTTYHASWLWSNDPKHVLLPSGQRTSTPGQYVANLRPKIKEASIIYCNIDEESTLGLTKNKSDNEVVNVPGPTMKDCCHPLAVYGEYPAWIRAEAVTQSSSTTTDDNEKQQNTTTRPYLKVKWIDNNSNTTVSIYDVEWLQRFQYNDTSRLERKRNTEVKPINAIRQHGPPLCYSVNKNEKKSLHDENNGLINVKYQSIINDDGQVIQEGLFQLLHSVFQDGAAIVSNTPMSTNSQQQNGITSSVSQLCQTIESMSEDDLPVSRIAKAMSGGDLSHGSLYGNIFHVRVGERNSNNVAYTSSALCPHQDLAYYESPPGMQLLHCIANGSGVVGGESTLIDVMAAAYQLRELRPESFECLVKCPATFVKQRDGACMTYRRPHIVLAGGDNSDIDREITAVFWSPPFEAPVCLPPHQVDRYYEAYADFERLLNGNTNDDNDDKLSQYAQDFTWQHKLQPGEMLVFNNRRMVHGRRAFFSAEGVSFDESQRHLVGCYTNIDDTLNSYRVLLRERGDWAATLNVGNGTSIIP